LKEFGWDCKSCSFFAQIEKCALIVNVYKHGKGSSLKKLAKAYPTCFRGDPLAKIRPLRDETFLDHEWVEISEPDFDEIAAAFRLFWEAFPERLFLR
jgi:hypothetical protein